MDKNKLNRAVQLKKDLDEVENDLRRIERQTGHTPAEICYAYKNDGDETLGTGRQFFNSGIVLTAAITALKKKRDEIEAEIEKL